MKDELRVLCVIIYHPLLKDIGNIIRKNLYLLC